MITTTDVMEPPKEKLNDDLQQFMDIFKPDKFKLTSKGLELRSIVDLHGDITIAKAIINKLGLKLSVLHTAEMLTFRGFEVNYQ